MAEYPSDGVDRSAPIDAADQAMYAAKSLGRNQAISAADPAIVALGNETVESSRDALALAGAIEALADASESILSQQTTRARSAA